MLRNARQISALFTLAIVLGGFVFFAPVVTLGATPTVTETFSLRLRSSNNAQSPMGSISLCLLGDGAVLINGIYYPSVALNQSVKPVCHSG